MISQIDKAFEEARVTISGASSRVDFDNARSKILGPNGTFRELMKLLSGLPKEERPSMGQAINACKDRVEEIFKNKLAEIENRETIGSLGQSIDPTLMPISNGEILCHPLTKIRNRIVEIFSNLGFSTVEGSEIETEWFCFDALNTPESHPSRDDRDTFYFGKEVAIENVSKRSDEQYVLRTHTSTVQIRTMLQRKPPIRILSPGMVFRRDAIDATHYPTFHQCEGLVVDEGITVCDLKSILDFFFKKLTGENSEIRMRPSFFPFVSPGFEVDFRAKNLGKLSNRWIEICGCGMVAPNVFKNCGYVGDKISGFAFGMGIERLAMLLYGIDDIRLFFQNDSRFLKQFKLSMF
ncbi:MAG: phenylalanine--tRNA ligase subunit alpha [Puniceicoccales bacterium]|jgi:phenylalanyl-tRNA synthetase alpha chain|nr:phenylalanine--tRNA ligase subunit alpha [Puniceicoccales bacterium]